MDPSPHAPQRSRTVPRAWLAMLVAVMLLPAPALRAPRAAAGGASLPIDAVSVLEQGYVEPVQPVALLNAALAGVRAVTNQGADVVPDIPAGTPEADADAKFAAEFARAEQFMPARSDAPLAYAATEDMLHSLNDSHTYYVDPTDVQELQGQLFGGASFTGIGAEIAVRPDSAGVESAFVENVFPGSPALRAGVKRFDRIVSVNGRPLARKNMNEVSALIRGPAGTVATLTVQRDQHTLTIRVRRAPVVMQPVAARFLAPGVAYLQVFEFSKGAGARLRAAIRRLVTQEPIRSVVLDLRDNPGGLLTEAAEVGGAFLPNGAALGRVQARDEPPALLRTAEQPLLPHAALAVLVDGRSASGSELLAGAFEDDHRGTIIGERTAGALGGSTFVALPEGAISVTIERILTPDGTRVEGAGVTPDVDVPLTASDMEQDRDTQLGAALETLETASGRALMPRANPLPAW